DIAGKPGTAGDGEKLREAPAYGHVPVAIHDAGVARMQPATTQGFRRLLRLTPITRHETTAQAHFAHLAGRALLAVGIEDADLLVGQRPADRRELVPGNGGRLAQRHEAAKLALAVALDQRQLELVAPSALERARHQAPAAGAEARDRAGVIRSELR